MVEEKVVGGGGRGEQGSPTRRRVDHLSGLQEPAAKGPVIHCIRSWRGGHHRPTVPEREDFSEDFPERGALSEGP